MADKRRRKPISDGEESGQPGWRQPLPKRRKKVHPAKAKTPRPPVKVGLRNLGAALAARRPGLNVLRAARAVPLRLRVKWRRLLVLPLLVGIAYLVGQVTLNDAFYVYGANIQGNQRVPAEVIYRASRVDRQHILWLRPDQIAADVKTLPWVADAMVSVRPPNRVTISVLERQPLVAWQTISQTVWFASDGTQLPITGDEPPLVLDDEEGAARSGNGLRPKLLQDMQVLHAQHPEVTTLRYGVQEGLYYKASQGWLVYLGTDGQMTTKLALLRAIQPQIAARKASTKIVDLRVEGDAYLR